METRTYSTVMNEWSKENAVGYNRTECEQKKAPEVAIRHNAVCDIPDMHAAP